MSKTKKTAARMADLTSRMKRMKLALQSIDELTVAYVEIRTSELEEWVEDFRQFTGAEIDAGTVN